MLVGKGNSSNLKAKNSLKCMVTLTKPIQSYLIIYNTPQTLLYSVFVVCSSAGYVEWNKFLASSSVLQHLDDKIFFAKKEFCVDFQDFHSIIYYFISLSKKHTSIVTEHVTFTKNND